MTDAGIETRLEQYTRLDKAIRFHRKHKNELKRIQAHFDDYRAGKCTLNDAILKRAEELYHHPAMKSARVSDVSVLFVPPIETNVTTNPGYVYLVKAVYPERIYKIGKSSEPKKRLKKMGVKLPFPIEVMHLIRTDDMSKCERALHIEYDDKRLEGEWFELDERDVKDILIIDERNYHDPQDS